MHIHIPILIQAIGASVLIGVVGAAIVVVGIYLAGNGK